MTKTQKADALLCLAAWWQHIDSAYAGGCWEDELREEIWWGLPGSEADPDPMTTWASAALSEVAGMGYDFE